MFQAKTLSIPYILSVLRIRLYLGPESFISSLNRMFQFDAAVSSFLLKKQISLKLSMANIAQNFDIPRLIRLLNLQKAISSLFIYNINNKSSKKVNHSTSNHFGSLVFSFLEICHVFMMFILTRS